MPVALLQSSAFSSSPIQSPAATTYTTGNPLNPPTTVLLYGSLFPTFHGGGPSSFPPTTFPHFPACRRLPRLVPARASLLENPVLWAGRLCIFYALLKAGLAGSQSNPLVSDITADDVDLGFTKLLGKNEKSPGTKSTEASDLGFTKWLDNFWKNPDKEAADRRKLVSKWHPTTKGTLKRNYRVPAKSEGRRLLKSIASLLSEDDHFVDATSHKGCQIRRETAHGESVCCNNVRALFDELPTPHLVIEITAFPAGPLTERDYAKAEKLERVLRSSPSI
ncbi:hypothetical protein Dimus_011654 [Dionaea muscipula]